MSSRRIAGSRGNSQPARTPWSSGRAAIVLVGFAIVLPALLRPARRRSSNNAVLALAYVVMALGLNIVVGFAGLLDLGYVAFYAIGAYTVGWFGLGLLLDGQRREGHPRPRREVRRRRCRASTSTSSS